MINHEMKGEDRFQRELGIGIKLFNCVRIILKEFL
jgi:hypothetical protein